MMTPCNITLMDHLMAVTILLNNECIHIDDSVSIDEFLTQLNQYNPNAIAIKLNKMILPHHLYKTTILKDHDSVEIITPISGG
ncbi:MAG: sulfur carrier protein ThiS [Legionellales bacterium]|nr:sulfur carrier protein ThiS [Legionellales bacterium]